MIRCIKIFMKFRFPYFLQGTTFFFLPIFFSNTLLSSWNKSVQKNSLLYAFPRLRGEKNNNNKKNKKQRYVVFIMLRNTGPKFKNKFYPKTKLCHETCGYSPLPYLEISKNLTSSGMCVYISFK